jgi:hypothetical protein
MDFRFPAYISVNYVSEGSAATRTRLELELANLITYSGCRFLFLWSGFVWVECRILVRRCIIVGA